MVLLLAADVAVRVAATVAEKAVYWTARSVGSVLYWAVWGTPEDPLVEQLRRMNALMERAEIRARHEGFVLIDDGSASVAPSTRQIEFVD